MIIGALELDLYLPEVRSLKEKRSVLKSLLARLRNTFNVAAAEVDKQDVWQSAVIGVATVTNSTRHADQIMNNAIHWIEDNYPQLMIVNHTSEIIS
ncbi:MAG: hypothetical protein CL610_09375 [Anaerolineaceae bacterium]|nr:hypothetical protein [Anaerolineaceae bacterium]